MKSALRKLLLIVAGALAILAVGLGVLVATAPSLPPGTDTAIDEVLAAPLPELITGDTGTARSGEVDIWFESIPPAGTPRGTILLIMGAVSGALAWPQDFIRPLVEAGYRVVRYDHRGLGMSDWIEYWNPDNPYTLEDMAQDALAVLDAAGVNKAHIVGVSMGGMIAQRLAISHAERVLSLTSVSSSAYLEDPALAPETSPGELDLLRLFFKYGLWPGERNAVKLSVGFIQQVAGDGGAGIDVKAIAQQVLYEKRRRRGYNPAVMDQHVSAIFASGSRYEELGAIGVPTLIVHGTEDFIVPLSHGERCAELIPGARTLWLNGAGHIIPRSHLGPVLDAILETVGGTVGAYPPPEAVAATPPA